jgi:hypothetical protein
MTLQRAYNDHHSRPRFFSGNSPHERHGLDAGDTERLCWFDLEALTLTLLDD